MSLVDNSGNIYSSGRHIVLNGPNTGDKPSLIRTDADGNEILYSNLIPFTELGLTHTINWFADSTIALGAAWVYLSGGDSVGVIKTDRQGNVLKIRWIFNSDNTFRDGETTFDNKLLLVGGFWQNIARSHAFKLNSDLEYDSVYTQPLTYDSLCPYPIPSDTIYPDCVIVGMDEPEEEIEQTKMKVYPNPASSVIHIELPAHLTVSGKTNYFNVTTTYYQWDNATLEVYDFSGKSVCREKVGQDLKQIDLDVSGWKDGMYVVRLVFRKQVVGNVKVLIIR
jgi:hypothetical protein